jgi:EpsD family peptidyl-prolyl cis-trans isomerase
MKARLVLIAAVSAVALAACGNGAPKGQVVAKVGKSEVTVLDLQSELRGARITDPKQGKQLQQAALNGIIQRKLLADAAKSAKIDKSPEFARQEERLRETLLVRTWQDSLARAVPAPNADEVQQFIATHPDLYSAHKKIAVEGVRFAMPNDPSVVAGLKPLNTLDDVTAFLKAKNVPFQPANGEIDTLAVDPRFTEQLLKLAPNAVFVVPQNNAVLVGHIKELKVEPVANNIAVQHATQYLRSKRTQEAVQRRFQQVLAQGKPSVKYAKGYEPPPPTKPGAPPAGAPAAGAAQAPTAVPAAKAGG